MNPACPGLWWSMMMTEEKDSPLMRTHGLLHKISKWVTYAAMAMTVIMMLMVVIDVFMRFAFNKPILGSVELASYMLSIIAFTTIPFVESEAEHIVIPLLFDRFPKKVRLLANTFVALIGLGIVVLIGLASFFLAAEYIGRGKVTQILCIPLYPFVFIAALCISLYAILLIVNAIKYIQFNK
jgi:TRAP-type C4-dicarboxylate transport system permease small subunit